MRPIHRTLVLLGAGILIAAFSLVLMSEGSHAGPGSLTAPDFTLPDVNGVKHRLSDYKGRYVVLEWLNFNCPCVQGHYKSNNMQSLQKGYREKGVVWLSIVSSAPGNEGYYEAGEMGTIAGENGWAGTALLLDPAGKVGRLFNAKTTPHMFVIDPAGKIIYKGAIDNSRSTDESAVKEAINWVAAALEQSMSGKPVTTAATQPYGCSVKY